MQLSCSSVCQHHLATHGRTIHDGTSKAPEVQIDVGADVSLDMPFTQIEGTLLERAVQVLQRCVRETPPDLHAHWVRHSRETVYKE